MIRYLNPEFQEKSVVMIKKVILKIDVIIRIQSESDRYHDVLSNWTVRFWKYLMVTKYYVKMDENTAEIRSHRKRYESKTVWCISFKFRYIFKDSFCVMLKFQAHFSSLLCINVLGSGLFISEIRIMGEK